MPNLVNQILFSELQSDLQNMGSCVVVDVGALDTFGPTLRVGERARHVLQLLSCGGSDKEAAGN